MGEGDLDLHIHVEEEPSSSFLNESKIVFGNHLYYCQYIVDSCVHKVPLPWHGMVLVISLMKCLFSLKFLFVPSFLEYLNCEVNVMIEVLFTRKVRTFGEIKILVLMFFSYSALVVWCFCLFSSVCLIKLPCFSLKQFDFKILCPQMRCFLLPRLSFG